MSALEIVILVLAAVLVGFTVVFNLVRRKKRKSCGGSCGSCPYCGSCGGKKKN